MRGSEGLLSCSFCGGTDKQVEKLIAGPHAYICDRCVSRARAVLVGNAETATTPLATIQRLGDEAAAERCSFCGKSGYEAVVIVSTGTVRICDECVDLCEEIIAEEPRPLGQ